MYQDATPAALGVHYESGYFSALVRREDRRAEVALRGELDMAGIPVLVAAITPLLRLEGCSVELDARELSFLDASGIGCIVRIRYVLRARGGELAMRSVSPLARRLLVICGLSDLLADLEAGAGAPESTAADLAAVTRQASAGTGL